MLFGIYPGSVAGDDIGGLASGPPDDPEAISRSLATLQGGSRALLVRAYLAFTDDTDPSGPHPTLTPADATRLLGPGRRLDLVAQYQSRSGDVAGYCRFLDALVEQYGAVVGTLQVAEEPNVTGLATLDGDYPKVREAVAGGVPTAARAARRLGHTELRVGFNTTPLFGPAESFVAELVDLGGSAFVDAVDYAGLDFFPDVFRPVGRDGLAGAVRWILDRHRREALDAAGLAGVPLHITEHGWPTGPDRDPERQAEVIDTVVRAAVGAGADLDLRAYVHFALRDADSAGGSLFHRFGLLTDSYVPKPAFATYTDLVASLGDPP